MGFLRTGGMAIKRLLGFPEPSCLSVGTNPTDLAYSNTWVWEIDGNDYLTHDRATSHPGFWTPQWTDPRTPETSYLHQSLEYARATTLWLWVPQGGCTLVVDMWGAEGQGQDTYRGLGGYIQVQIDVDSTWSGQRLWFRAGQKGQPRHTFGVASQVPHGGGAGGTGGSWANFAGTTMFRGHPGGGGTHVTITSKVNNRTELPLAAAGGGGGMGDAGDEDPWPFTKGGDGGYPTGEAGEQTPPSTGGLGGTQTLDGTGSTLIQGIGGRSATFPSFSGDDGGGGGGWRGGAGGGQPNTMPVGGESLANAGGGGSSGFTTDSVLPTVTLLDFDNGVQTGHGAYRVEMTTSTSRFKPKRNHITVTTTPTDLSGTGFSGNMISAYKDIYQGCYPVFWLPDNFSGNVRLRSRGEPGGIGFSAVLMGMPGYTVGDLPASAFPLHFYSGQRGLANFSTGGGALVAQAAPWGFTATIGATSDTFPYGSPSNMTNLPNKGLISGGGGGAGLVGTTSSGLPTDIPTFAGGDSCWGTAEDGAPSTVVVRLPGLAGGIAFNGDSQGPFAAEPIDTLPGQPNAHWGGAGAGGWKAGGSGEGMISPGSLPAARGAGGAGGVSYMGIGTFRYFELASVYDESQVTFQFLGGSGSPIVDCEPISLLGTIQNTNLGAGTNLVKDGNFCYTTATTTDRLTVTNVTNPAAPVFAGTISSSTSLDQPGRIVKDGNFCYVTSIADSRLTAVNVSNPASMSIAGFVAVSANAVIKDGNTCYVSGSGVMYVVDVTNPAAMTVTGSVLEATQLGASTDLVKSGNTVFVVTNSDRITSVDVTTPATPVIISSLLDNVQLDQAQGVVTDGTYCYVTCAGTGRLTIVDVSNPAAMTVVSSLNNLGVVYDVVKDGNYCYVSGQSNTAVYVIDVSTPTNPFIHLSYISSQNLGGGARGLDKSGDNLYVHAGNSNKITIVQLDLDC